MLQCCLTLVLLSWKEYWLVK